MGLITKEVEITLNSSNYMHYKELGYDIPMELTSESTYRRYKKRYRVKKGEKIKVNINDLPKRSKINIEYECDCCHNIYPIDYGTYNTHNHDGKYYCQKCHSKVFFSGDKSHFWKPDKTDEEREQQRIYQGYKDFIKRVLARDNYTCQVCNNKNTDHDLVVHHLDGYDWCKEKRTDDTNGITLCPTCHRNFHAIYGCGGNTKEQFEEWYGKTINLLKYEGNITPTRKIYCIEEDKVYNSADEICEKWNYKSPSVIYNVCNHRIGKKKKDDKIITYEYKTAKRKHLLWYDEYITMSKEEIENFLKTNNQVYIKKKVICLTTNEIFESISEANRHYNIKGVEHCCLGIQKTCGKLEDGTKLQWEYYSEKDGDN